jgi:DNA-binding MarR family transcriptional regulator
MQDVADAMAMDRSTLGHNLRPLERDGLVELGMDERDRRTRKLRLTAKGERMLAAARPSWKKAQQQFESCFGEGAVLQRLLRDVVQAVHAAP